MAAGMPDGRGDGTGGRGGGGERPPDRLGHPGGAGRRPQRPGRGRSIAPRYRGGRDGRAATGSGWSGSTRSTSCRPSSPPRWRLRGRGARRWWWSSATARRGGGHRGDHAGAARGARRHRPAAGHGPADGHPERGQRAGRARRWPRRSGSTTSASRLSPAGKVDELRAPAGGPAAGADGGRRDQRRPGAGRRRRGLRHRERRPRRPWPTATSPSWATTCTGCPAAIGMARSTSGRHPPELRLGHGLQHLGHAAGRRRAPGPAGGGDRHGRCPA